MGDYFAMQNYYADVKPPTRKEEALARELNINNESARNHNNAMKTSKPITGPIKRYCPLDENILKPIKSKKLEDLEIELPRYRCTLCKSVFEGYGLELYHETKKNLKAITFEYTGNI